MAVRSGDDRQVCHRLLQRLALARRAIIGIDFPPIPWPMTWTDQLRWNYRRRPIRGCGHCRLQPHRHRQRIVHIIAKLIERSIVFSSFNNVDLLRSMSANCCMPRRRGWGIMAAVGQRPRTMAAVGRRPPPWLAGVCILPSFG